MRDLLTGMIVAGYLVGALFFLKFWRRTRDRLFLVFAASFGLLAVQRTLISFSVNRPQFNLWLYGLRLMAFLLILLAIWDKNRERSSGPTGL